MTRFRHLVGIDRDGRLCKLCPMERALAEIQRAVKNLDPADYQRFRVWFMERDWTQWDQQIESDSASGDLDWLVEEAIDEKRSGDLKDL